MNSHRTRFKKALDHLVARLSDTGYAPGNADIRDYHIRQAYAAVMEIINEAWPLPQARHAGGMIRNSHGQTVNDCVAEARRKSPMAIEKTAAMADHIARNFLTEGNRNMANFYESVASDLYEHLKTLQHPAGVAR